MASGHHLLTLFLGLLICQMWIIVLCQVLLSFIKKIYEDSYKNVLKKLSINILENTRLEFYSCWLSLTPLNLFYICGRVNCNFAKRQLINLKIWIIKCNLFLMVYNCTISFAESVRSKLLTVLQYPHLQWENVRAPVGWAQGQGATCSQATQTAAFRCGIWPLPWIWLTKVRIRVGSIWKGVWHRVGFWHKWLTVVMYVFLRCRWSDWRGATQITGSVWSEHISLRYS